MLLPLICRQKRVLNKKNAETYSILQLLIIMIFKTCSSGIQDWRFPYYFLQIFGFFRLVFLQTFFLHKKTCKHCIVKMFVWLSSQVLNSVTFLEENEKKKKNCKMLLMHKLCWDKKAENNVNSSISLNNVWIMIIQMQIQCMWRFNFSCLSESFSKLKFNSNPDIHK